LDEGSARSKAATYIIHASSGIQTHDPGVLAGEEISWLRLRGHCDRRPVTFWMLKM
jgi:hypothetical protein